VIKVRRAAPLLTVQDAGRFGYRADGVTTSGPLDPLAHAVANGIVRNAATAASLEGCLGGAAFTFHGDTAFSLTGAELEATLDGNQVSTYAMHHAREGAELVITRVARGAVWYLALRGGIDVPPVLGSRSTLVSGGLGGLNGEPIRAGTELQLGHATRHPTADARPPIPDDLRTPLDAAPIPLTPGPHSDALTGDEWREFLGSTYAVSNSISRVGFRLEGPTVPTHLPADLASEPACTGAMQLPPEGQPIVLMADHPTIGGYPMIGVVPRHAIGRFAQRPPGMTVRFERETAADAREHSSAQKILLDRWLDVE
jgi:allophanate hydrolase